MIVGTYDCRENNKAIDPTTTYGVNTVFWHYIKVNNKIKPFCED